MNHIALAIACSLSIAPAFAAQPQPLRLALPPAPSYASALTKIVLQPYTAATHQKVRIVSPKQPGWDLAQLAPLDLATACAAGTVRKLDWNSLGGRTRFLPMATSDCGVGAWLHSTVLTWDSTKIPAAPNWGDFWNVIRLPGRRALRQSPIGTLEIALMADGVAPRDVYSVLSGKDGPDRAFRKLDQLRPYIIWWNADTDPMAIVASGGAVMSSAPSDQVTITARKLHRHFGIQWNGSIAMVQSWAIAAKTTHADQAAALISVAADPGRQAAIFAQCALGSTLPPDPAAKPDPAAPDLTNAVPFDANFWRDHQDALTQRFQAWLKH